VTWALVSKAIVAAAAATIASEGRGQLSVALADRLN
jgi:hypothetical protein